MHFSPFICPNFGYYLYMCDRASADAVKARLDAYLKEYDMLAAENRVWLASNDPKLTAGFAACIALATAGFWQNKYPLFLLIPLVTVFLGLILLFQLENIIHLGAQLAALEEKINELIGGYPSMTFFNNMVLTTMDRFIYRDPVSHWPQISPNYIFGPVAAFILGYGSKLAFDYGFPALQTHNPALAAQYLLLLRLGAGLLLVLLIRSFFLKKACLNIARAGYLLKQSDQDPKTPGVAGPVKPESDAGV